MASVWFNGQTISENELRAGDFFRAWHYADGGFETIFFSGKEVPLYCLHKQRALAHAHAIGIELWFPSEMDLVAILAELSSKNNIEGSLRCRITWFRQGKGLYKPQGGDASVLVEVSKFSQDNVKRELSAVVYRDQYLTGGKLSVFKKIGAQTYVDALRYATIQQADDAVLLNTRENVAEAASSNIILKKNGIFIAPAHTDGGVEGVMLSYLTEIFPDLGYTLVRQSFSVGEMMLADEILSVNALQGISCITSLCGKQFASSSLTINKYLPLGKEIS